MLIITNAPEAYDYRYTRTIIPVGTLRWMGRPVRVVVIEHSDDAEYQKARYQSGLYVALTAAEATDDLSVHVDDEVLS